MSAFLAALRFLSVLPVPGAGDVREADWSRATAWYPAVGLVLGVILAGLDWALGRALPGNVAAAVLLVAWVGLSGALHLDGFVDCCDALLVPASRERRLEILHDVHAGTFGIVGVAMLLLLKYTALAALPAGNRLPALLLIPTLARWGMTGAVLLYPYARPGPGLGRRAKTGAAGFQLALATGTALVVTGLAWGLGLGWVAAALLILVLVAVVATAGWIRSKLGGLTGDAYGAICEVGEAVCLLALAAVTQQGMWA
jgi:cobalamin 5'-phosphate synthase/cobalamin synthase